MANRLVSVDDNLNLPTAVLAQLTESMADEFSDLADAAAASASAAAAASAASAATDAASAATDASMASTDAASAADAATRAETAAATLILPRREFGVLTLGSTLAAGASTTVAITFTEVFSVPPFVTLEVGNSRLTTAYSNLTGAGFTYTLSNWSPGAAPSGSEFQWMATERPV